MNLYGYVFNDPSNYSDPSGTWGLAVHDVLTHVSLHGRINFAGRVMLSQTSVIQDIGPHGAQNHMHFLRNPGQDPGEAITNWRTFVSTKLNEASQLDQKGDFRASLEPFGEAIHAIADSFSPVHSEDGQPAEYDPESGPVRATMEGHSVTDVTGHENTSDLTPELRAKIVDAIRAAYDFVYGDNGTDKVECTGSRIKQREPC